MFSLKLLELGLIVLLATSTIFFVIFLGWHLKHCIECSINFLVQSSKVFHIPLIKYGDKGCTNDIPCYVISPHSALFLRRLSRCILLELMMLFKYPQYILISKSQDKITRNIFFFLGTPSFHTYKEKLFLKSTHVHHKSPKN